MMQEPIEEGAQATFFGPVAVDTMLRETFRLCWISLPAERKNVREIEAEMRRLFERALNDMKQDAQAFGFPR